MTHLSKTRTGGAARFIVVLLRPAIYLGCMLVGCKLIGCGISPAALDARELPTHPAPPALSAGTLLVATPKSHDPDLKQAVVLIAQSSEQGVVGIVLNRPTDARLGTLFPNLPRPQKDAILFEGGPLHLGVRGLLRSRRKPDGAAHVIGDVYLISSPAVLEKTIESNPPSTQLRVFAGYAGWSTQQLRDEVALGWWKVLPGEPAVIFDPHPAQVWFRLNRSEGLKAR